MTSANTHQVATDSKAIVLGLGVTGVSIAACLARQGIPAVFADSREQPPGMDQVQELMPAAEIICGEIPASVPADISQVLVSPGLSMDLPLLADARRKALPVRSDIDLFMSLCAGTVIGVTGSNGKSTVTSITEAMLTAAGARAVAGGNLGTPALDLLAANANIYVLELSSFQLERSEELPLHAAVMLNISADHLDHHGSFENYAAAKAKIYRRCGTAIVNRDAPESAAMVTPGTAQVGFGLGKPLPTDWGIIEHDDGQWIARGTLAVMPVDALQVYGRHNLQNVLAAFALADSLADRYDVPLDGLVAGAQNFAGLPHRMQLVASGNGIFWVDDSKATNEAASIASIEAITGGLVLIAGGDAKGGRLEHLPTTLAAREVQVIALGKDRDLFVERLASICETHLVDSMTEAVQLAARIAKDGDTVLLAPACSSLDMYSGYAERGECFATAARDVSQ